MFARLELPVSSTRILASRLFIAIFLLLLLFTESAAKHPIVASILFFTGLVFIGVATVGRLWCAMYIGGYKNMELATEGPYSMTRNPLYFCSFLGFTGVGFVTETFSFVLGFSAVFFLLSVSVIKREEAYLHAKFGRIYLDYCARTPRFFPTLKNFCEPETYVVRAKQFRRTMKDVVWFVWAVGIIKMISALQAYELLKPIFKLP